MLANPDATDLILLQQEVQRTEVPQEFQKVLPQVIQNRETEVLDSQVYRVIQRVR